tara:strand:+ start:390 stop:668 length:279 start_codon:yes stop_codon:yes gene_type:complete
MSETDNTSKVKVRFMVQVCSDDMVISEAEIATITTAPVDWNSQGDQKKLKERWKAIVEDSVGHPQEKMLDTIKDKMQQKHFVTLEEKVDEEE